MTSPTGRIKVNHPPLQQIPRPTNPFVQELVRRYEECYDIFLEEIKKGLEEK